MDSQRILSGVSEEFETSSRSKIFVGVDSVDDRAHQSASNVKVSDMVHRIRISHDKEMNSVQHIEPKTTQETTVFLVATRTKHVLHCAEKE